MSKEGNLHQFGPSVPAKGAPAVSKERHGIFLNVEWVEWRRFPESKERLDPALMVKLKERLQRKLALKRKLIIREATPVRKLV